MTIDDMISGPDDGVHTRSSVLMRMKAGDRGPPLFFFPGSRGRLSELALLAAQIRSPVPIYGVEPRGVYPDETPQERIEDMAEYALNEIKLAAQGGPYLLVGYSVGGLVAFETACRLSSSGASVPLLALLDTYPNELTWPIGCQLQVLAKHFVYRLKELRVIPRNEIKSYLRVRVRGVIGYLWRIIGLGLRTWQRSEALEQDWRVHYATVAAASRYRPGYYGGKIRFFRPDEIGMQPGDPRRVWHKFAQGLEIYVVPGAHLSMVSQVETLAALLSTCLETAIGDDPLPTDCGNSQSPGDQVTSPASIFQ